MGRERPFLNDLRFPLWNDKLSITDWSTTHRLILTMICCTNMRPNRCFLDDEPHRNDTISIIGNQYEEKGVSNLRRKALPNSRTHHLAGMDYVEADHQPPHVLYILNRHENMVRMQQQLSRIVQKENAAEETDKRQQNTFCSHGARFAIILCKSSTEKP